MGRPIGIATGNANHARGNFTAYAGAATLAIVQTAIAAPPSPVNPAATADQEPRYRINYDALPFAAQAPVQSPDRGTSAVGATTPPGAQLDFNYDAIPGARRPQSLQQEAQARQPQPSHQRGSIALIWAEGIGKVLVGAAAAYGVWSLLRGRTRTPPRPTSEPVDATIQSTAPPLIRRRSSAASYATLGFAIGLVYPIFMTPKSVSFVDAMAQSVIAGPVFALVFACCGWLLDRLRYR